MENIDKKIERLYDKLVKLRKELHTIPELGFQEYKTAEKVANYLEDLGLEVERGIGGTGVVGLLKGNHEGPTFAIRACLDALAILEKADVDYISENKGAMHACGHDGNMTMTLGAANILYQYKDEIYGNVKFIFQPSEENTGGAESMIKEGVLDNPKVNAIITPHNWALPQGVAAIKAGPVMASSDLFDIEIIGKAGHGTWPHLTVDPIVIASDVVSGLQKIISREIDPTIPALITIGKINGGTAENIIPEKVTISGTTRVYDNKIRDYIQRRIEEVAKGITQAFRADYKLTYNRVMPPVINDKDLVDKVTDILTDKVPEGSITTNLKSEMGCEEFSVFQEKVPGIFIYIGNESEACNKQIHDPEFIFNDEILTFGVKILSEITLGYLK